MSNATLRIACPLPSRDVGVRMRRRGRGPAAERVPSAVARGAVAVGRRAWARKTRCVRSAYGACGGRGHGLRERRAKRDHTLRSPLELIRACPQQHDGDRNAAQVLDQYVTTRTRHRYSSMPHMLYTQHATCSPHTERITERTRWALHLSDDSSGSSNVDCGLPAPPAPSQHEPEPECLNTPPFLI